MARTWEQVQASPDFQQLSADQKEAARMQYFDQIIAPLVPPDQIEAARGQFIEQTKPRTPLQKVEATAAANSESPWEQWMPKLKRQGGLAARTAIEGLLSPFTLAADVPALGYNLVAKATDLPPVPEQGKAVSGLLTKLGLPEPETMPEKISNVVGAGLTGGGAQTALARGTAGAVRSPTGQSFMKALGGERTPQPVESLKQAAATNARRSGYALSPEEVRATMTNKLLQSMTDIRRAATAKNQKLTNELAGTEIGLKPGAPINAEILTRQREPYGSAYRAVEEALPYLIVDSKFTPSKFMPKVLEARPTMSRSLGGSSIVPGGRSIPKIEAEHPTDLALGLTSAEKAVAPRVPGAPFPPGLAPSRVGKAEFTEPPGNYMNTKEAMDAIKELRKAANADFKMAERVGGSKILKRAKEQQRAADQLENLVEQNLKETGQAELYTEFRNARTALAKIHSVERALNPKTGNISAAKLAKEYKRLNGRLRTIADTYMNFPEVMQPPTAGGIKPADVGLGVLGAGGGALLGHPNEGMMLGAAAVTGRHMLDKALTGDAYQNYLVKMMNQPRNALLPQVGFETAGQVGGQILDPVGQ